MSSVSAKKTREKVTQINLHASSSGLGVAGSLRLNDTSGFVVFHQRFNNYMGGNPKKGVGTFTYNPFPYNPCMVYLPTFDSFLW